MDLAFQDTHGTASSDIAYSLSMDNRLLSESASLAACIAFVALEAY